MDHSKTAVTARAMLCGLAVNLVASAAMAEAPRAFSEIIVSGNARFSDRDVLATANLQPGEVYSQEDLRAAIEALEFTGEFDFVRIRSEGAQLFVTVDETPAYEGALTFGLGYENDTGVFGRAALSLEDALGVGADVYGELNVASEVQTAGLRVVDPDAVSEAVGLGVRLSYGAYEYDNTLFNYDRVSIAPYVQMDLAGGQLEVRATFAETEIRNVAATASGILQADAGTQDATELGLSYRFGAVNSRANRFTWGALLSVDYGVAGDAKLIRSEGQVDVFAPLPFGFALRSTLEVGHVAGQGSDLTRATDRFVLGGASLRGFERGGVSVRDIDGAVVTDLGGTSFGALRTDLLLPLPARLPGVDVFVLADVGSVWGLDSPVAPSGTLQDTSDLRASAGLGASYEFGLGRLEGYLATPVSSQTGDQEQVFGLTFRTQF